jgi:hypothetical protein
MKGNVMILYLVLIGIAVFVVTFLFLEGVVGARMDRRARERNIVLDAEHITWRASIEREH